MIKIEVLSVLLYGIIFAYTDVFLLGYCLNLILSKETYHDDGKIVGIEKGKFCFIGLVSTILFFISYYYPYFYPVFIVIELILILKQFDTINPKIGMIIKIACLKVITEILCIFMIELLFENSFFFNEFHYYTLLKFFWMFVSKYIQCFLLLLIYRKNYKLNQKEIRYFKNIGIIISLLYGICVLNYVKSLFHVSVLGKIVVFTLLVYNLALIVFDRYQIRHDRIEKEYAEKKKEFEIIDLKNQLQESYNVRIQEEQNHTRHIKHSINNQLRSIYAYIQSGENELAMDYIEKIIGMLESGQSSYHTGHIGADAILDEKLNKARELSIDIKEEYGIIDFGDLTPFEITVLLGCSLDNAIEAIERIKDDIEKKLTIHIYNNGPYLAISIGNSVTNGHKIRFDETCKKDDCLNHGFGVKDMRDIAHKYQGSVCYEVDEHFVLFNAILYVSHN